MQIPLDEKKVKKNAVYLSLIAIVFLLMTLTFIYTSSIEKGSIDIKKISLLAIFCLITLLLIRLVVHQFTVKKYKNNAIVIKDGKLTDNTKLFNKIENLDLKKIESIKLYRQTKKMIEYRIKTKTDDRSSSVILNQFKNIDYYISNYFVKIEDLHKLIECIEKRK